ncbi:MAG TPA: DegV family protein [Gemmatimonadales bacterium]|nr:DegV family protein [Gemmatimonadales bacterium]
MTAGIAYVDGPRLARALVAAADWVAAGRDEINRINVFPVPDGDTGTNLNFTLHAVVGALHALGDAAHRGPPLPEVASAAARAAVLGARGNSGILLAHFLLGFSDALAGRTRASIADLAAAFRRGADRLRDALDEPREGTMLTVARQTADAAERLAPEAPELGEFMRRLAADAERSVAGTPALMPLLAEAGVVDAGGAGFARMLEGVVRLIEGNEIPVSAHVARAPADLVPAARVETAVERDFRYCTEVLVRGDRLPAASEVREALHQFGGSIVVAVTADILKLHVHTDTPEAVFGHAARWGRVEATKADDMRAQHRQLAHPERQPASVVVDSSADLSDAMLAQHRIAMVPLQVAFGATSWRDRIELAPEEFYRRLRAAPELPTTSQPTPADFARVLGDAARNADEVIAVLLSSALSGTFKSGIAAARAAGLDSVHLFDSRTVSLGVGLLALRAAELAESGWRAADIVTELNRVRGQSGMFLTVDRYENLLRSGRVTRGRAWLAGMLDLKPIMALDDAGRVVPVARVRGSDKVVSRVLALLARRLMPRPRVVRFGVAHANAPAVAERIRAALVQAYRPRDCFVSLVTGVLATHVGEGAWGLFYQIEDGTPTHLTHGAIE